MKDDLFVTPDISIPSSELEITATKSSGPGGQHVNKTSSRITIRFNIKNSTVLTQEQKIRLCTVLRAHITKEGDLIITSSYSRSQEHNRKDARDRLAKKIYRALHIPKRRTPTTIPKSIHESRLAHKSRRSKLKKLRTLKD